MKQLIKLSGHLVELPWTEPRGVISALHHEAEPGVFLHATLGAAGLVFTHGDLQFGIALDELLNMVRIHEPMMGRSKPPEPPPLPGQIAPFPILANPVS